MEATSVKQFSDEAETCEECIGQEFAITNGLISNPGKFESEPLAAYHAYHVRLDGFTDESDGAAWLIGNMICEESDNGFIGSDIYETEELARETWDKLVSIDFTNQYD